MFYRTVSRFAFSSFFKTYNFIHYTKCHTLFGIKELIRQEKPSKSQVLPLTSETHALAIDTIKRLYLCEHVFVRSRDMDIYSDCALDEYLLSLLRQGNSLYTKSEDGGISAICVNFASSYVDTKNLCDFASYRQDPNTKELLYFIAKLQETPNLWDQYKQKKIFEIKMLAVAPEYRRRGLATLLAEKAKEQAWDLGYNVVRMDCINDNDYKIAEQCMLQCVTKFPVHKLGDKKAPFIKEDSKHNRVVRVYVDDRRQTDNEKRQNKPLISELV